MKLDLSKEIDQKRAKSYLDNLMEKGSRIELKKVVSKRTTSQNSYLHVCLTIFSKETGYTISESKDLFSDMLPELMLYDKKGRTFRRSTSDLSTAELSEFIEKVREVCNNQLGIYVPDAEEYLISKFEIEREYGI